MRAPIHWRLDAICLFTTVLAACSFGVEQGTPCEPACDARVCGDDGCGGVCGTCEGDATCDPDGQCVAPEVPGAAIGSACAQDADCAGATAFCLTGPDHPAGYCTIARCAGEGGEPCPAGARCVDGTPDLCLATCTAAADCRESDGYACGADGTCSLAPICPRQCDGRICGDDGCGGECGTCEAGAHCDATGQCVVDPVLGEIGERCNGNDECAYGRCLLPPEFPQGYCTADCDDDDCPVGATCRSFANGISMCQADCASDADCRGDDGYECAAAGTCAPRCESSCLGKECGDDGCGGTCDVCPSDEVCDSDFRCVPSTPIGAPCGDDGDCGEGFCFTDLLGGYCSQACSAGACPGDASCFKAEPTSVGICLQSCRRDSDCRDDEGYVCDSDDTCWFYPCEQQCDGRVCGGDSCGGSCGTCTGGKTCNGDGQCVTPCNGSCAGKVCGDDGCGVSCGGCGVGESCTPAGQCSSSCVGSCDGKVCGDDGCGVSCGGCDVGERCASGQCVATCVGSCDGKTCGDDGCGVSCGTCPAGKSCTPFGWCLANCTGSCAGKDCGDDGCGISCGTCDAGEVCNANQDCVCAPQCTGGKNCGDDGCGGTCGTCAGGEQCDASQHCTCAPQCDGKNCGDNGCGGTCGSCTNGKVCGAEQLCEAPCTESCGGKQCGDNGCDGSCGTCSEGFSCDANRCVVITSEPPVTNAVLTPAVVKAGTSVAIALDVSDLNNDFDLAIDDIQSVVIDMTALGGGSAVAMSVGEVIDLKTRRYTTTASTSGRSVGPYFLQAKVTDKGGHVVYDTVTVIVYTGTVREVGAGGAYTSISAGIAAAAAGDFVRVAAGTWTGSENKNLAIGKAIIVGGGDPANMPIIDCENAGRAFHLRNSNETASTVIAYLGLTKCNAAAIRLRVDDGSVVQPTLVGLQISGNTNADIGGGLVIDGGGAQPTIVDCLISGNTLPSLNGGGIAVLTSAKVTFRDVTVSGNTAGGGAGIYVATGATLEMVDSLIRGNIAGTGSGYGGGLLLASTAAPAVITRTRWVDNQGYGGAINTSAKSQIVDSEFVGNRSKNSAGAIFVQGCAAGFMTIRGSTFRQNTAAGNGGAIETSSASLAVADTSFAYNEGGNGGAIFMSSQGCTASVTDSLFDHNIATGEGGAVYSNSGAWSFLRFTNNAAKRGGAISSGGNAQFSSVLLDSNRASEFGGAIYFSGSTVKVSYATLVDNSAVTTGPGIHIHGGTVTVSDSIFVNSGIFVRPDINNKPVIQRVNADPAAVSDTGLRINDGNGYFVGSDGNIFADPRFVTGPRGDYYLSHTAAGQPTTSACVNPVGGIAVDEFSPVQGTTTRTDGALDTGTGDLGYHYRP